VGQVENLLDHIRKQPKGVRFSELTKIRDYSFGRPRQQGSWHLVYRMPWSGDPRVNIQNNHEMAKPYQVRGSANRFGRREDVTAYWWDLYSTFSQQ